MTSFVILLQPPHSFNLITHMEEEEEEMVVIMMMKDALTFVHSVVVATITNIITNYTSILFSCFAFVAANKYYQYYYYLH